MPPSSGLLTLGSLFLLTSLLSTAQFTPPFSCSDNMAETPLLRAGAEAELVGTITLNCSGGTPPAGSVPTVPFEVSLSAPFAGRISTAATAGWTEALLTIDDPASPVLGVNTFQGQLVAPNRIRFDGVPVDPPGAGMQRRFRISNLRVAVPAPSGTPGVNPAQVLAFVSATGGFVSVPITNPQLIVGFVQTGMRFQVLGATGAAVS